MRKRTGTSNSDPETMPLFIYIYFVDIIHMIINYCGMLQNLPSCPALNSHNPLPLSTVYMIPGWNSLTFHLESKFVDFDRCNSFCSFYKYRMK